MAAAEHAAQKHPYHLVDPSVWPLVGSIGGVVLAFGAALFMHPDMFGAAPDYTGGVPVDEWLEANRGEA